MPGTMNMMKVSLLMMNITANMMTDITTITTIMTITKKMMTTLLQEAENTAEAVKYL